MIEAKDLTLPDYADEILEMTPYDIKIWYEAFQWYNETFSPIPPLELSCRQCYSKVYTALRKAKQI